MLQMLTSQFERMKMEEHEKFGDFWFRLQDCTHSMWGLGQQLDDSVIVRKILSSLPARFDPKVIAIEESKNVGKLDLKELVGSIQTFELKFAPRESSAETTKAEKSIALKSTAPEGNEEDIALFVRNMNRAFRKGKFMKNISTSFSPGNKKSSKFEGKKSPNSDEKKCYMWRSWTHFYSVS